MISFTRLDAGPQYSPDGRRILFVSDRSGTRGLWVCDSNGEDLVQLVSALWIRYPRWFPDGRYILFDNAPEGQFDVYAISAERGPARRLTHHPANDGAANWSNDGQWIYFASTRSGNMEVWRMPASGGEARQITQHGGIAAFESPDGEVGSSLFLPGKPFQLRVSPHSRNRIE
jgi:Tol biopolymer transport system component